jgi:hypothetical protein
MAAADPKSDDLRRALGARLDALNTDFEKAKDRRAQKVKAADDEFNLAVQGLEDERRLVSQLLRIEDRRHGGKPNRGGTPTEPVSDFFFRAARATGPKSKEDFKRMAEEAGYEIDGRGVHAVVVNGVRGGRLGLRADGRYEAIVADQPAGKSSTGTTPPFMFGDNP